MVSLECTIKPNSFGCSSKIFIILINVKYNHKMFYEDPELPLKDLIIGVACESVYSSFDSF